MTIALHIASSSIFFDVYIYLLAGNLALYSTTELTDKDDPMSCITVCKE